jgi:2-polyprenyl-3-methyl-5-hydroxy-6-metoxy-1,4-benzoquinol methylase
MFERRAETLEVLDGPGCDDAFAERSYRFMRRVNRFLGGCRVVQRFLETEASRSPQARALRVLDIGSGICDIPLAMVRQAKRRGVEMQFTCLDVLPQAARIARRNIESRGEPNVRFLQEDVFAHEPEEPYDCAIGSMFFHHLRDSEILKLIGRLRGYVRRSVLINDLQRSVFHYLGAVLLRAAASSDLLKDATLSVQRGFRVEELRSLLCDLESVSVYVDRAWFCRVFAIVRFNSGGDTL